MIALQKQLHLSLDWGDPTPTSRFLPEELPEFAITVAIVLALTAAVRQFTLSRPERGGYRGQLGLFFFIGLGLLAVLITLPIESEIHRDVFALIGIVLSAAVALSSTTFLGNLIAGGMLRTVSHFKVDDWIRVGEHFGRVTERGLLHTEIQTEYSDLTTLPNLMLATHPVTVVRQSGTIISAVVGIGFDVAHARVEDALLRAAASIGLAGAFVAVDEIGDHTITYRVAGKLEDVGRLLSKRSSLRRAMLDELHRAEIEILSPTFLNVIERPHGDTIIPAETGTSREAVIAPEDLVFDKAQAAKDVERKSDAVTEMKAKIQEIDARLPSLADEAHKSLDLERARISGEIKFLEGEIEELKAKLTAE